MSKRIYFPPPKWRPITKQSKKTINPKSYHVQCWHCEGRGKNTLSLLDAHGFTKGFSEEKCTVCSGKGLVYGEEEKNVNEIC